MLLRANNLLYFLLLFIHVNLFASNILDKINAQEDILDVKEAFKISLLVINNDAVIKWNIQPKHYLYLDDINVQFNDKNIAFDINKSSISEYDDIFFGKVSILRDIFEISISLPETLNLKKDYITVKYRGCAEAGFCYPFETYNYRISEKIL